MKSKTKKYEFVETERTDGDKKYTYKGTLKRIKELINEVNEQNPNWFRNPKTMSDDDLIETGFLHLGFDYLD